MKPIPSFIALVVAAGLSSCISPNPSESGPTPMRTSGAYSAASHGQGSTYHSRDVRDPQGDWRHDDNEGATVSGQLPDGSRYTSWRRSSRGPAALPTGARRVTIEGEVYYTVGNSWYKAVPTGYREVPRPY